MIRYICADACLGSKDQTGDQSSDSAARKAAEEALAIQRLKEEAKKNKNRYQSAETEQQVEQTNQDTVSVSSGTPDAEGTSRAAVVATS